MDGPVVPARSRVKSAPENVPWGWRTAIGLPVAHLIIQIVLALGGSSLLLVVLWATSRLNPLNLQAWATSGVFVGSVGILGGLVSLALIYAVITGLRKRPFRATIKWVRSGRLWPVVLGAVLLGGAMDTVTVAMHKPIVPDVLRPMFQGYAAAAVMTLFAVIVTPVVEEILFRGVMYPVSARSLGVPGGVAFVSVLFGLAHVATYGVDVYLVGQTLVAGLFMTWLRARTGSLVPSIAAHAALNLYATLEAIVIVNVWK